MRVYHVPYRFVEYPKWVRLPDGREVVVSCEDEEGALLRGAEQPVEAPAQPARPRRARRAAQPDAADLV